MAKPAHDIETLQRLVSYNPETGAFTRLQPRLPAHSVPSIGIKMVNGYRWISLQKRHYYAHRLAWVLTHGRWPKYIDHINGDKEDNRLVNLREASNVENGRHRTTTISNTGYFGVHYRKDRNTYSIRVSVEGKLFSKSGIRCAETAAKMRDELAKKHFGEFASLNFPDQN